ncbi:hypothetical protein [Paenibacillus sambharensis]|uniref:hypothetical protein n=1 Tax=Paenibacillus sambharensis TaxID=1803190 RepID=UPI0011B6A21D|nr:hypothetical protein [Paenibacillus sambharensis]
MEGTIFIKGREESPDHITIIAAIEIDPDDWGGVAFYIPEHWSVSNVTSSYPDHKPPANAADYIATWTTESNPLSQWNAWIEIGRDRSYTPTGGGSGTVVLELVRDPDRSGNQPKSSELGIEVGSREAAGRKEMGTDTITISVPLE